MSKDMNKDWDKIETAREANTGCLSMVVGGDEGKTRKAYVCEEKKADHTNPHHNEKVGEWWFGPDTAQYERWQISDGSALANINTAGADPASQRPE